MRTKLLNVLIASTLLFSQLAVPPALAGPGDIAKKGANKIVKHFGFGSPSGDHRKEEPIQIKGKWVYILSLTDQDGSRVTYNFDAKWDGQREFQAFICNVPRELRMTMSLQRKGDKKLGEDSNRGSVFRHKSWIVLDGGKNYLAERGFDWSKHKDEHPAAFIMLIEKGLTEDEVYEYFDSSDSGNK